MLPTAVGFAFGPGDTPMRRWVLAAGALAVGGLCALPALAKDAAAKKKDGPVLRWAHSHQQAVEEARERNCVLFVTIHAEH
jgi:hypothetical protein